MRINQTSSPLLQFNYLPAELKEYSSGWMIDFSVWDPSTKKMRRKQIRLNKVISRFRTKREARNYALSMVAAINSSLAAGDNPFITKEDARKLTPVKEVFDRFINEKTKELRPHAIRSYSSFISIFSKYLKLEEFPSYACNQLTFFIATCFMDHAYNERNISQNTYNNYRKLGCALSAWMVEKCYLSTNIFEKIKPKKKTPKKRILIPEEYRRRISDYFRNECPTMNIVIRLIYYSLIRPNEILQIKLSDIHLDKKYIIIPGDNAKNHKERYASLTPELVELFERMSLSRYPKTYHLFGESMLPEKACAGMARFRKEWDKMRRALNIPAEMQLYSLRDTGITEMLKSGIDDLTVMQHADHHSLAITSIYASHADEKLTKTIYERAPKF